MSVMTHSFDPLLLRDKEHPMHQQHSRLLIDTMKSLSLAAQTLKPLWIPSNWCLHWHHYIRLFPDSTHRIWCVCHVEKMPIKISTQSHTHNWCFIQHQTWQWKCMPASLQHAQQGVRWKWQQRSSVRAAVANCNRVAICARPHAMPSSWHMCLCQVNQRAPNVESHVVHHAKVMCMCLTIAVDNDVEREGVDNWSSVDVAWVVIIPQVGERKGR